MLSLITAKNKVVAVKAINYSATLSNLKHFLRLTGYLQSSVYYYMQIAQPLQNLKTILFKPIFIARAQQKVFVSRIKVSPLTNAKLALFLTFKKWLFLLVILVYYSIDYFLSIDLDTLKEFKFSVILFYTKNGYKQDKK